MNDATLKGIRIMADAITSGNPAQEATMAHTPQSVFGSSYSEAQLRAAFERVENRSNWKLPVSACVHVAEQDVTREAIIFFTGSVPTFKQVAYDLLHVAAAGYYEAIGA